MTDPAVPSRGSLPRVAVVGTGYWGKNLVRVHHEFGALKLICDKDETLLARFREQYPGVEVCLAVKDVLDHALVAGNPARRIGWMCACGEKLDQGLACSVCGTRFKKKGSKGLDRVEERAGG